MGETTTVKPPELARMLGLLSPFARWRPLTRSLAFVSCAASLLLVTPSGLLAQAHTVSSVSPTSGATGVATNTQVDVQFSDAMNSSTLNTSTFTLESGSSFVAGAVSLDQSSG